MDPAPSVEAPDGVRLAPPLHRLGPFLGRVVLCEALQGAHELAVDEACRERVELIRDHRHAHLVEQGETFPYVAAQDEQPGLCDPSDGARRRVAPRTDLDRAPGPLSRAVQVARQHSLVRRGPPQATRAPTSHPDPPEVARLVPNQPRTGAIRAVSRSRCIATRTAAPAAAT